MAEGLQLQAVRDEAARAEEPDDVPTTEDDELGELGDRNSGHPEEVATATRSRSSRKTKDVGVNSSHVGYDECIILNN